MANKNAKVRKFRDCHCNVCNRPLAVGVKSRCWSCRVMLKWVSKFHKLAAGRSRIEPHAVRRGRGLV